MKSRVCNLNPNKGLPLVTVSLFQHLNFIPTFLRLFQSSPLARARLLLPKKRIERVWGSSKLKLSDFWKISARCCQPNDHNIDTNTHKTKLPGLRKIVLADSGLMTATSHPNWAYFATRPFVSRHRGMKSFLARSTLVSPWMMDRMFFLAGTWVMWASFFGYDKDL